MLDVLYPVIDLVCLFVLIIIISNLHATPGKSETLKTNLILNYLVFGFIFTDFLWGLLASRTLKPSSVGTYIDIIIMLFFLALISFYWFYFSEITLNGSYGFFRPLRIATYIILLINLLMIFSTPWTNIIFTQKDMITFVPSDHWKFFQNFQFIFYLLALIRSISLYLKKSMNSVKKECFSMIWFSVIPVIGYLFKNSFENIPCLSISFLLAICYVFVFNITKEKERLNVLLHEKENLSRLDKSDQIIKAFTESYECLYLFRLAGGAPDILKNSEKIQTIYEDIEDKKTAFVEIIKATTNIEYLPTMLMFINIASLESRMEGKALLSQEFIDVQGEWCRANWIAVDIDEEGFLRSAMFGIRNIDTQKRKELEYEQRLKTALKNQNEIYAEILQMQSNGILVTDIQDKFLMINDAAKKLFNVNDNELENKYVTDFLDRFLGEHKAHIQKKLHMLKVRGGAYSFELTLKKDDVEDIYLTAESKVVKTTAGEKILITSFVDITKNKKIEKDLVILSETDSMTGLNNRRSGARKIEYLFSLGKTGLLCLLDADKFKHINDTYGHIAGDKVIIAISDCMKKTFRDKDVIMRLGGDEFAMYAVGITDEATGVACINRFFDEVNKIDLPEIEDNKVSVSLGAVFCDDLKNNSFDDYYQMADRAMYKSKETPGTHFEFFRNK